MRTIHKTHGDISLRFEAESCQGEYLDTKVFLNGNFLCWITFADVEAFSDEIGATVSKFRI